MLRAMALSRPAVPFARSAARRRLSAARPALAGGCGGGVGFGGGGVGFGGGGGLGGGGGGGGGGRGFPSALLLCAAALVSPPPSLAATKPQDLRVGDSSESQLSASVSKGVTLVFHAVARMVPVVVLALFGYVLLASSLRVALAEALKSADVLVTGGFAVAGWLLSSFLDGVDKRFDKVDKRFDKSDERVGKQFEKVERQLEKLTELLTQRLLK